MEVHVCTCFHPLSQSSLRLSVGAFNPFTFKVIIDMYDPVTIFLIVLGLFFCRFFPSVAFPA